MPTVGVQHAAALWLADVARPAAAAMRQRGRRGAAQRAAAHRGVIWDFNDVTKPKMMNAALGIDTSRRVIMCRNDLRTKVGKAAKKNQL